RRDRRGRPGGVGGAGDPPRRGARRRQGELRGRGRRDACGLRPPGPGRGSRRRADRARARRRAAPPFGGGNTPRDGWPRGGLGRLTARASTRSRRRRSSPSPGSATPCDAVETLAIVPRSSSRPEEGCTSSRVTRAWSRSQPRPTSRSWRLCSAMSELRVGIGIDAHAFSNEKTLVLGGVEFPGAGLAGHSDGDVVTHALIDAILGAAGLADIGTLFPSGEAQWEGASSLALLARAYDAVREGGWELVNA